MLAATPTAIVRITTAENAGWPRRVRNAVLKSLMVLLASGETDDDVPTTPCFSGAVDDQAAKRIQHDVNRRERGTTGRGVTTARRDLSLIQYAHRDALGSRHLHEVRRRTHAAGGGIAGARSGCCAGSRHRSRVRTGQFDGAARRTVAAGEHRRSGVLARNVGESAGVAGRATWIESDVESWSPTVRYDVIFSNASLHWISNHRALLPKLMTHLSDDGALAFQVPDNFDAPSHVLMREVASQGPWAKMLAVARR